MPKRTKAARKAEKVSKRPLPPPPPVDDTPELGGAGALGGNGGNERGAFGATGARDRPPDAELFTVERTLERDSALANVELVPAVRVVLVVRSTRSDDERRTTTLLPARLTLFECAVRRTRSWPAAIPTRRNGSASSGTGAASIEVGTTMSVAGAEGAGCGKAAVTSTGLASATGGAAGPAG